MKKTLITSILAIMLLLVVSVSAFSGSVDSTSIAMTEDTPLTDAVELTLTLEDGEDVATVVCEGDDLTATVTQDASVLDEDTSVTTNTYTVDLTLAANHAANTNFVCTATSTASVEEVFGTVNVVVTAVNDAPTFTSTAALEAVEDEDYTYTPTATDVEDDELTFSLTTSPSGMTMDTEGVISWTPDEDNYGNNAVTVTVSDGTDSTTQDFSVSVRPDKVCEYGIVGDLDIDVSDPDDGDEYFPNEEIDIDVQVENDGDDNLQVTVQALLYDLDDGNLLRSVKSDDRKVRDGDEENFDLTLNIPTSDFDAGNTFMLYVVAYEDDDDHCTFEEVEIDIEREDEDVVVTEVRLMPEVAKPGSQVTATVSVANIGEDDQEAYIRVKNGYLNLVHETAYFDLEDYSDEDDSEFTTTITFELPEDATAGEYWIDATVFFDSGAKSDSMFAVLTVDGESQAGAKPGDLPLIEVATGDTTPAKAGEQVAVPVVINNAGNTKATFKVEVSGVEGWASVMLVEQPGNLNAGESGHAYVYLDVNENAAEGLHDFSVNLLTEGSETVTKKVSVSVSNPTADAAEETSGNQVTGFFSAGSSNAKVFWVLGDIVLVVIGLFFLRLLFKK